MLLKERKGLGFNFVVLFTQDFLFFRLVHKPTRVLKLKIFHIPCIVGCTNSKPFTKVCPFSFEVALSSFVSSIESRNYIDKIEYSDFQQTKMTKITFY